MAATVQTRTQQEGEVLSFIFSHKKIFISHIKSLLAVKYTDVRWEFYKIIEGATR